MAITDKARGALKTLADNEGYPTFVIPDYVGGRFSVLTPVGLLPLAAAGVDIAALVRGAQEMERATADGTPFEKNPAAVYAAVAREVDEQRLVDFRGVCFGLLQVEESFESVRQVQEVAVLGFFAVCGQQHARFARRCG